MLTKFTILTLLSQAPGLPPLPRVPVPLPSPPPIICPKGEVPIGPVCVPNPIKEYA